MYSSSVSLPNSKPTHSSDGCSFFCGSRSQVSSVEKTDGKIGRPLPKNLQSKQQIVQTEVRKPKAKRVKYVASRKTATGRGTSTTSPTTSLGIIEEDGDS